MPSSRTLRALRRRLGRTLPLVGLLGWVYGLPGFVTDGRWWWQSTSRIGVIVAFGVVTVLVFASIAAAAAGNVPSKARRVVRRLALRFT